MDDKLMNASLDFQHLGVDCNETSVPLAPPTRQERRIMYLMINGITTNTEIAVQLRITPDTAAQHIDNLRAKFQAHSRAQLVAYLFHSILISLFTEVPLNERSIYGSGK